MGLDRRQFVMLGSGALAAGCETLASAPKGSFAQEPALRPLTLTPDRLMRITVCTRPFRAEGPRLEIEAAGGKRLVHNYGHGGSGWSLAWGCAEDAVALAFEGGAPRSVAVIGAGVIGLTTAVRLAEAGGRVTIYAKEFPSESRSARATGVWSPSSRIGLADAVSPDFAAHWERWARTSYAVHQRRIGTLGEPVEFLRHHYLAEKDPPAAIAPRRDFLHLSRRVRDLTPPWSDVPDGAHPFPVERVRSGLSMVFNVARYAEALTHDFLMRGGALVRKTFADRAALLALDEPVIVNCAGYGAKALVGDDSLAPVRGQINWFAPQPEARYGVFHRQVSAYSRRDGVIVQYVGDNDDYGFGDDSEIPDRDEMTTAIGRLAPLFA